MSELFAEQMARVRAPPPKKGFRPAPHLVARQKKQTAMGRSQQPSKVPPNKIAKAMHAAQFDDGSGIDALGWGSLSSDELAKEARKEALARQAMEKAKREQEAAAQEKKRKEKEDKEARRRAEVQRQKEAKRKRKEEEKKRRQAAAAVAAPPKALFPVNKQTKKAAKAAKKRAEEERRQQKLEGPTKAERRAARKAAEAARVEAKRREQEALASRTKGGLSCGVVFLVSVAILLFIGVFFFAASNHKQIVPVGARDFLEPYIKSTIDYFEDYAAPAARHVQAMNEKMIEEQRREEERKQQRQQQRASHHDHGDL